MNKMSNIGWFHFLIFYLPFFNPLLVWVPLHLLHQGSIHPKDTFKFFIPWLFTMFDTFNHTFLFFPLHWLEGPPLVFVFLFVFFFCQAISVLPLLLFFCSALKCPSRLWSPFFSFYIIPRQSYLFRKSVSICLLRIQISIFSSYLSPDPQICIHYI